MSTAVRIARSLSHAAITSHYIGKNRPLQQCCLAQSPLANRPHPNVVTQFPIRRLHLDHLDRVDSSHHFCLLYSARFSHALKSSSLHQYPQYTSQYRLTPDGRSARSGTRRFTSGVLRLCSLLGRLPSACLLCCAAKHMLICGVQTFFSTDRFFLPSLTFRHGFL